MGSAPASAPSTMLFTCWSKEINWLGGPLYTKEVRIDNTFYTVQFTVTKLTSVMWNASHFSSKIDRTLTISIIYFKVDIDILFSTSCLQNNSDYFHHLFQSRYLFSNNKTYKAPKSLSSTIACSHIHSQTPLTLAQNWYGWENWKRFHLFVSLNHHSNITKKVWPYIATWSSSTVRICRCEVENLMAKSLQHCWWLLRLFVYSKSTITSRQCNNSDHCTLGLFTVYRHSWRQEAPFECFLQMVSGTLKTMRWTFLLIPMHMKVASQL